MSSVESHKEAAHSFGRWVRTRRRELGLTQDELARRVGCAQITLRKIEHDDLRPSVQIAERLAMALNIPLEERAIFVRLARAEREPEPLTPTPAPTLEEFGTEDLSGRAVRGYALAERIGTGGMGAVYRAVQPTVEREVAIKIILPQYANQPDFIRRFEAEAQLVARLEHPHIVPLYDYWREPNVAFLVMRLLRGGSLRSLLEKGALPLDMLVRLLEQIGSALSAAHRAGVVHRDLKPANVMLDEDSNAYLADFGIAKNLSSPNFEDQTQADVIIGSPAYISPEQIRSEFVRPQTDIYALGVMLYELLTGAIPFSGPTPVDVMYQHLSAPLPSLAVKRVGLPTAWDDVIAHATAKDPLERYADVESMLADVRLVANGVSQPSSAGQLSTSIPSYRLLASEDNPYKGLRAFGEGDAADFFGRAALTGQLLARLSEGGDLGRFLAVVGPSGSGKSSIVGAGLVPALRRGGLPGSENWFIVPMLPGPHPLEELEAALLRVAVNPPDSLLTQLREDQRGLLRAVHRCLPDDPQVELVLVIDQFEEVFTLVQDEAVRAHLLDSLVTAILDERSRLRVIITLRADFIDRPLSYTDFGELLRQRMEVVLPLTPDELEQAILGPAERVGLQFEAGLVQAIMRDAGAGDQPGALPLLQYALTELFEKRDGNLLTKNAYQAIGGVLGALGRRAEEVYRGLSETDRATARQLFLRLVTLGEGTEDTRRRVLRAELIALTPDPSPTGEGSAVSPSPMGEGRGEGRISSVVDSFGKHRLLTFDRDPLTRGPTVEVAHEALLREWPRLREWLNDSRADVRLQRQLALAAHDWQNANRDASYLLIGAHLEQFEGWALSTTVSLTTDERVYLDVSVAEREKREAEEANRQQRELEAANRLAATEHQAATRLRKRNRVIAMAGGLALLLAVLAGVFGLQATRNAEAAQQQQGLSRSRELAAVALAQVDQNPERGLLIAIEAGDTANTYEAQDALRQLLAATRTKRVLRGHTGSVRSAQFSPDGKRIVTASWDHTARLWDAVTGQEVAVLRGHADAVTEAHFSPDGKYIVTASDDNVARVWDAATGQEVAVLRGHEGLNTSTAWPSSASFSPDGQYIVTTGKDNIANMWETATGQKIAVLRGHEAQVLSAQFSPDGKRIVTGSDDKTARIWDAATGQEVAVLRGHEAPIAQVQFSPDGKQIVTASVDHTARVWDATTGQEVAVLRGNDDGVSCSCALFSAQFSPDGKRIVTGGDDAAIRIWDAATGKVSAVLRGHTDAVACPKFSPDGKQIVSASLDETIRIWDVATGKAVAVLRGHTDSVVSAEFSPDGKYIVSASNDMTARVWDAATNEEAAVLRGHQDKVNSAQFSTDGKQLVTASDDSTTRVWDAATGQEVGVLGGHEGPVNSAQFSPDGKRFVTTGKDKTARIWDAATDQETIELRGHADEVTFAQFSPDGRQIVTASKDKTARVWDAASGAEITTLHGHEDEVTNAQFSPDSKRIVTASWDKTARVWDTATGKEITVLRGHEGPISSAQFSPDGQQIVTAGWDNITRVWDAATGHEIAVLRGHEDVVTSAQFSPDGQQIVTASWDKTVRVWDRATGQEVAVLRGHTDAISDAQFSPDGKQIVTASWDGTGRIYVARIEDLMALAQARITRLPPELTCKERVLYLRENVVCIAPTLPTSP